MAESHGVFVSINIKTFSEMGMFCLNISQNVYLIIHSLSLHIAKWILVLHAHMSQITFLLNVRLYLQTQFCLNNIKLLSC